MSITKFETLQRQLSSIYTFTLRQFQKLHDALDVSYNKSFHDTKKIQELISIEVKQVGKQLLCKKTFQLYEQLSPQKNHMCEKEVEEVGPKRVMIPLVGWLHIGKA